MKYPKLNDEEIAVLVRESDKEAYSDIVERYQNKLFHYLRKFIGDPISAEDILQEVFIKAYRGLFGFDASKKFSSWIFRIAHNEAVDFIKKNRERVSLDEFELQIIDEKIDLAKELDTKIHKENLEKAIAKIKPKFQEALILYSFEEKTYEEISDILHLPVGTVGTYISRGKKQLKDLLKKYER